MKMSKKRPQLVKKTHAKDTRGLCEGGGVEAGKYGGLLGRKSGSQRWRRLSAACHPFANGESDWLAYVNVWESVRLCGQQNGGPTGICCVDLKNWATIVVVNTWPAQTDHMAAGPASRGTCIIIVCISRISYGSQATQGEGEGERVSARANMHNLLGTPWKRDSVWSRIWQTEKGGKREGYAWIMHATCNDCTEIANEFSRSKNEFPFPFLSPQDLTEDNSCLSFFFLCICRTDAVHLSTGYRITIAGNCLFTLQVFALHN